MQFFRHKGFAPVIPVRAGAFPSMIHLSKRKNRKQLPGCIVFGQNFPVFFRKEAKKAAIPPEKSCAIAFFGL